MNAAERRRMVKAWKDRAYQLGKCTQCGRPHKNVTRDRRTGEKRRTRICAGCQEKRNTRQNRRRFLRRCLERWVIGCPGND